MGVKMIQMLRLPDVTRVSACKKWKVYADARSGLFPKPVKTGKRVSAWLAHEVEAVLKMRVAGRTDDEIKALILKQMDARKTEVNTIFN